MTLYYGAALLVLFIDLKDSESDVEDELMELDHEEEEEEQMDTQGVAPTDKDNETTCKMQDDNSKNKKVLNCLPRSKEDLASLIRRIHETVTNSVIPRLQKCLDAKVGVLFFSMLIHARFL